MSWLRTDDSFTSHPKFEGWSAAHKWAFLELMHYCARYRTGGRIPNDLTLLPRSATRQLLNHAEASGWLEHRAGALWIHDFPLYNPTDPGAAERQRRARDKRRDKNVTVTPPHARARAEPVPSRPENPEAVDKGQSERPEFDTENLLRQMP